jgi:hypothetical protein
MNNELYVFFDDDKNSVTQGKWSVRDGMCSYDGFDTEQQAIEFMDSLKNKMNEILELVNYIDEDGIALDDYGNEVRDEEGLAIIVPYSERKHFKVLEREEKTWF